MTEMIGLRLPPELYATIAQEAKDTGNSMQAVIRQRMSERYEQLRKEDEIRRIQIERMSEVNNLSL